MLENAYMKIIIALQCKGEEIDDDAKQEVKQAIALYALCALMDSKVATEAREICETIKN
jgi:hypothetical protein